MKSWLALTLLLLAPAAGAEPLRGLVEHAPWVQLHRSRPPEPGRRYRGAKGPVPRWSTLALPDERILLALSPVAPDARVEVRVERGDAERSLLQGGLAGLVPTAWRQCSSMVPGEKSERVAEVLVPAALEGGMPAAFADAEPLAVRVLPLDVSRLPAGSGSASVTIDGVLVLRLDIEVIAPLPVTPREPVLAFYRGRLVEPDEADWPEKVDRWMLEGDLRALHLAGVTHATYYGALETLDLAREVWRTAGFTTEPLLVGWYPGRSAEVEPEQAREATGIVRAFRLSPDGEPNVFWTVDEPIREELQLARNKAAIVARGGGLSTATLQVQTAHALRHAIDLPLMDNYLSPRPLFEEAVRSVRGAGSTPWGYWQGFGESARFSRWNAGFRQLDEPTRGQSFYAYAHAVGDPLDDFDGGYRDMLMVYPAGPRERLMTLQYLGLWGGTRDLRLVRGAQALVRQAKLDGFEHPSVSALERELAKARRKWSSVRARWGRYAWDDVARPGKDGGPGAAALERTRQDILKAVARLQAARSETNP